MLSGSVLLSGITPSRMSFVPNPDYANFSRLFDESFLESEPTPEQMKIKETLKEHAWKTRNKGEDVPKYLPTSVADGGEGPAERPTPELSPDFTPTEHPDLSPDVSGVDDELGRWDMGKVLSPPETRLVDILGKGWTVVGPEGDGLFDIAQRHKVRRTPGMAEAERKEENRRFYESLRRGYMPADVNKDGGKAMSTEGGKVRQTLISDIDTTFAGRATTEADVRAIMKKIQNGEELPPILVSRSRALQDGRHRLEAYKRLGYDKVPTIEGYDPNVSIVTDKKTGKDLELVLQEYKGQKYKTPKLSPTEGGKVTEKGNTISLSLGNPLTVGEGIPKGHIGNISVEKLPDEKGFVELKGIRVEQRGKGLGEQLLLNALKELDKRGISGIKSIKFSTYENADGRSENATRMFERIMADKNNPITVEKIGDDYYAKLSPIGTPTEGGKYFYHGTNEGVLDSISKEGLRPMELRGMSSLSKDEAYAKGFAREGITPNGKTSAVMLRVKSDLLKDKIVSSTKARPKSDELYEILTKEIISPEDIEIKVGKEWIPLNQYKSTISPTEGGKR